jgi:hypothetical protein
LVERAPEKREVTGSMPVPTTTNVAPELLPHEDMEQESSYPVVARLVGGYDPIGRMTRAHVEMRHLLSPVSRSSCEIGEEGPDDDARRDLRRGLYGPDAVLALNLAQGDEGCLSIVPDSLVAAGEGKG